MKSPIRLTPADIRPIIEQSIIREFKLVGAPARTLQVSIDTSPRGFDFADNDTPVGGIAPEAQIASASYKNGIETVTLGMTLGDMIARVAAAHDVRTAAVAYATQSVQQAKDAPTPYAHKFTGLHIAG